MWAHPVTVIVRGVESEEGVSGDYANPGVPQILKACISTDRVVNVPCSFLDEEGELQLAYNRQMNSRIVKACLTAGCSVVGPVLAFSASSFGVKALESGGGAQAQTDSSSSVSSTRR